MKKVSYVRQRAVAPSPSIPAHSIPAHKAGPEDETAPTQVVLDRVLTLVDLERRARALDGETYFQSLRVPEDADARTIEIAYHKQLYLWHPSRLPPTLAGAKPLAAAICARLGEARRVLTDPATRAALERVRTSDTPRRTPPPLPASLLTRADGALERNSFVEAETLLLEAIANEGEQPRYLAPLAWAQAMKTGPAPEPRPGKTINRYDAQLSMLDRAIRRDPNCERSRVYRAELLKRSGYFEDAILDYRMAAKLNPRNAVALREVHAYEMARLYPDKKRGLLDRMLSDAPPEAPRRRTRDH